MNGLEYFVYIILCIMWFCVGYEMGKRKGFADATKIHFEAMDEIFKIMGMEEDKDGEA